VRLALHFLGELAGRFVGQIGRPPIDDRDQQIVVLRKRLVERPSR